MKTKAEVCKIHGTIEPVYEYSPGTIRIKCPKCKCGDDEMRRHTEPAKVRNHQPDLVRKAGPHIKPEEYTPTVCYACGGDGMVPSRQFDAVTCPLCEGLGEVG